jgi:AcrR family transcriptional regulator
VVEAVFAEHFEDKHDCLMQAVEDLIGGVELAARQRFERPAAWAERVRDALGELLQALARDPDRARVTFVEMLAAGPEFHERYRRALALFASLMEEGRACSPPGVTRLPAQASEAVVGGIVSIVHRRVLEGQTHELPALHGELTYFALLPYLEQERALAVSGLSFEG